MYITLKTISIQKIKAALFRAYTAYMSDANLPTMKVGDIKRINWSGCDC